MKYRIKEARDIHGWTQAELAERAGTTQQSIARYEAGEREPKATAIVNIAAACGVTISYVLGLDDAPEVALSADERELLEHYRSTDQRGRDAILAVARSQSGMDRQLSPDLGRKGA